MISKQAVEEQLRRIGCDFRFWGRSEVNELDRILMEDEIIAECVNGEYVNGFAMLLVTNHRLLLVDKKPFLYLTVEDLRYEMITEFNFNHRLLNASINIHTANKTLSFKSWNKNRLRRLLEYIQTRVLEMRQQQHLAQQFQAAAAAQYAQVYAARQVDFEQQGRTQAEARPLDRGPTQPVSQERNDIDQHDLLEAAREEIRRKSRWTSGRSTLGTYTRNRLPSIRRYGTPDPG
jgi:hypothetical protein